IVPLDNERRWYRYHHLFADFLRQRLRHNLQPATFHVRASEWYETNGLEMDAFHQAVAATDIPRAMRLIEGNGTPLYFRGEMVPVVHWLQAQPHKVLNAYPSLWVTFGWALFIAGQSKEVSAKLLAAEAALRHASADPVNQDLYGQIATLWAWTAVSQNNIDTIHAQATRALELLSPDNQSARTAAHCALGVVLLFRNERAGASRAFSDVVVTGQSNGNLMFTVAASIALASIQATDNQLRLAADTYRNALQMIADPTHLVGCEAHLGLARILYEWNELDEAELHALQSSKLAARSESENGLGGDVLRARMMLARHDNDGAVTLLAQSSVAAKTKRFTGRMQEIANVQVVEMLRRGEVVGAAHLANQQNLPLAQARAFLAQGEGVAALAIVDEYRRTMGEKGNPNEVLKALVVQAITLDALDKVNEAMQALNDALVLAEPGGYIRIFVDEGTAMATLLTKAATQAIKPDYVSKLLSVFALQDSMKYRDILRHISHFTVPSIESYSPRELEILHLMHQGRSNQEISERLFLSLSTVKWHNQNIFGKLQVQRRTEAVARAIELNLFAL
ncbi:MAG: LuxR C-terminal-related transcriptional regulator, partial [Undibacterium sp.]|nr:LuxR C-terminal-related transcriptional regulator [Undibacterium sp.]